MSANHVLIWLPAVVLIVTAIAAIQKHLDEDVLRDERIRVLERVTVSEHPAYSPVIYWEGK